MIYGCDKLSSLWSKPSNNVTAKKRRDRRRTMTWEKHHYPQTPSNNLDILFIKMNLSADGNLFSIINHQWFRNSRNQYENTAELRSITSKSDCLLNLTPFHILQRVEINDFLTSFYLSNVFWKRRLFATFSISLCLFWFFQNVFLSRLEYKLEKQYNEKAVLLDMLEGCHFIIASNSICNSWKTVVVVRASHFNYDFSPHRSLFLRSIETLSFHSLTLSVLWITSCWSIQYQLIKDIQSIKLCIANCIDFLRVSFE